MPDSQSRSTRTHSGQHWISKKYSLRRRWPAYVMLLILCATSIAILVLTVQNGSSPGQDTQAPTRSGTPAAIR
jgi:hypothetical protein